MFHIIKYKKMKTSNLLSALVPTRRFWQFALLLPLAWIAFSYLYTRGISPVGAALLVVLFPGLFRVLYRVACLLTAVALFAVILAHLIY